VERKHRVRLGWWRLLWLVIVDLLDQLRLRLNLPGFGSTLESRLRRLRRLYYSNLTVTLEHGQARDILHGHVEKRYRPYYEQMLSVEKLVYEADRRMPAGARFPELLYHTQLLSRQIAGLVDDLQRLEGLIRQVRDPAAPVGHELIQRRDDLRRQIEEAVQMQAAITRQVRSLSAVREERVADRLAERIHRLTAFLEDMEASYMELDDYSTGEATEASEQGEASH
jgi:hypothetical protein